MFRRIGRSFKEAWWGITHHFAMVYSTATAITLTLLLVALLSLLVGNIQSITLDVENSIQLYVTIEKSVEDDMTVIESMQKQIESIEGITSVRYSTSDEELNTFIEGFGEDGKIFEIYRGEHNPLPRAFIVKIVPEAKMSEIAPQVKRIKGIHDASYGDAVVEEFRGLLAAIRNGGYLISFALALLAVFLIHNTIRMTINSRKEEIGIMRLVGATNSYIRTPLLLEGIFIGIIGSIIPIAVSVGGYYYVYKSLNGQLVTGMLKLVPVFPFSLYVSVFVLGIGIIVGLIGSLLSTNKYLRWKR